MSMSSHERFRSFVAWNISTVVFLLSSHYYYFVVLFFVCLEKDDVYEGCPRIISRAEWGALPPKKRTPLSTPVKYAVVHHSDTPQCTTKSACIRRIKNIQNYHMKTRGKSRNISVDYFECYIFIIFKWRNWCYLRIAMTRKSDKHLHATYGTQNHCFDLIRLHQQWTPWSPLWRSNQQP